MLRGEQGDRFLQAHGALLLDDEGKTIGAVIVLNDVTRLQRLEGVRRDFVANVSHELKTPITSIKGFVETLRDGAIRRPADAEKFLEIVAKQADRMNSIIEDLLLLSRVEQDAREAKVALESAPVKGVILEAVQVCEPKAHAKDIRISVNCPDGLTARINAALLEQAIINLVDNAIKYSEPGCPVSVDAEELSSEVVIRVADKGCGIEPEHLSADIRAVLPRRQGAEPQARRHGARPLDREAHRSGARRHGHRRERARRGDHLLDSPAEGRLRAPPTFIINSLPPHKILTGILHT